MEAERGQYSEPRHNEKEYFDEIQDVKITKDMLDLAKHIVTPKAAEFEPEKFEDLRSCAGRTDQCQA